MCSTPAVHGSRMISPRPDASVKDSGIRQVFFSPDFDGNSKVDSPISPVLEDIDKARSAPLAGRSRRSKRSCTLIGLILVWLGVLLLVVMIPYCSLQIQEYKTVVSDIVSYYGWKFLPYSGQYVLFCFHFCSNATLIAMILSHKTKRDMDMSIKMS